MEKSSVIAYVALGANLGDRTKNIHTALVHLQADPEIRVLNVSSLLENPAVGGPAASPDFLNAVAQIETTLAPHVLLQRLLEIERQMGRVREHKWEPRVIDLDVILYGDRIIRTPDLTVPHPLMHERRFVLMPLAEIAPDARHPVLHCPVRELLVRLGSA